MLARVREPRRFIQALAGPRQVGKTTLIRQVLEKADLPYHYASADAATLQDRVGLQKFSGAPVRQRGSSPKLLVLNTALQSAVSGLTHDKARMDRSAWGRLVESAVGAQLVNAGIEVFYWRDRGLEVDYVARHARVTVAFEVKSGWRKGTRPGLDAFRRAFQPDHVLRAGSDASRWRSSSPHPSSPGCAEWPSWRRRYSSSGRVGPGRFLVRRVFPAGP